LDDAADGRELRIGPSQGSRNSSNVVARQELVAGVGAEAELQDVHAGKATVVAQRHHVGRDEARASWSWFTRGRMGRLVACLQ
jgi:hypothetical protein